MSFSVRFPEACGRLTRMEKGVGLLPCSPVSSQKVRTFSHPLDKCLRMVLLDLKAFMFLFVYILSVLFSKGSVPGCIPTSTGPHPYMHPCVH